nr:hypothetical protein [Klebsiella pneumoniae]
MNSKWQRAGQQVKPGLKIVGKLALLTALRYGPAGVDRKSDVWGQRVRP